MTFVALERPVLFTVIVNLTKSPTWTLVTFTVFVMFKVTCGFTVTLVLLVEVVVFSVEFTTAALVKVPFVRSLTTTQTLTLEPLSSFGTIQVILLFVIVLFPGALIKPNALSSSSTISTLVAFEGP